MWGLQIWGGWSIMTIHDWLKVLIGQVLGYSPKALSTV